MKKQIHILFFIILLSFQSYSQDSISELKNSVKFKGQVSTWAHFNPENPYPLYMGGRYLPQLNYEIQLAESKLIDFELSANLYGNAGIHFFDSAYVDGNVNPYRIWGRYSTEQLEIRLGLQKINFGSATMLRALRWFDQVDPRDPLQLTEGVWAALGRYYFLNNANLWLWALYGNKNPKGLEIMKTNTKHPEFGGRFQFPVIIGEAAISYNYRVADSRDLNGIIPLFDEIPENKIGIDTKLDMIIGLWFEGVWINKGKNIGDFTNQEVLNFGLDYTFGIGSGLNVVFEHMLLANGEKAFQFSSTTNFSGLSVNYPIGMFDNIRAVFYYDWANNSMYNFINWYRQFDKTTFYVMAYWNPENGQMPTSGTSENLYNGIGVQLMLVFNH